MPYRDSFQFRAKSTGLTAFATGGQANATPTVTGENVFAVVATAGDSALLPIATGSTQVMRIQNNGAASMNVFPQVGASIGSQAANAALAIPAGKSAFFVDDAVGNHGYTLSA